LPLLNPALGWQLARRRRHGDEAEASSSSSGGGVQRVRAY